MSSMSRRSVLGTTLGLAAASTLGRPYIANAQAKTATVWVNQGFIPQEDAACNKLIDDYMKVSGNKIDLSIMPFMAMNQKIISALTGGDVPDLVFMDAPAGILPQNAWDGKIEDVTDVVTPYESQLTDTAKAGSTFHNKVTKQRSYYLCPIKQGCVPFHIWGNLVEKAGYKLSDAPKTWDEFWNFFKPMQAKLHASGLRKIYACGLQITTVGPNDGNGLFQAFMIANGGQGIVTPDGKLHTDDPKIREAAIKSVEFMTGLYKDGVVPPEALSWNDADDNNAFHEKLILMDFDGTLSTELAMIANQEDYHNAVTMGLPLGNDGKPMVAQVNAGGGYIPKGAANVAVAKDLMTYWMRPEVTNDNMKAALGRWVPANAQVVKTDPFWLQNTDPHVIPYVKEIMGPTIPFYEGYTPAWGQVNSEQLWGTAHADVIKNGMTASDAIDKAFKRAERIFSNYTMG
jgi:multiple sugar transport system substrate-binding protein